MTLIVESDFKGDGPDFAYAGFGKLTIFKGARLIDVTGPDRYGYLAFVHDGARIKGRAR